jgi:hypothetical protein
MIMLTLAEKLSLESSLTDSLKKLNEASGKKIRRLTEKCSGGDFSCLKKQSDLMRLAVILCCAVKVHERYKEKGISDEIYYHTMSDIKIWCENNSNKGLKQYGWLKNHVSFNLFRLGRLQFLMTQCRKDYPEYGLKCGDPVIEVHVPASGALTAESCEESIAMAREFFAKYFPEFNYRYFVCRSWLLDSTLRDFLPEDSNILQFQKMFVIADCEPSNSILRFVFKWNTNARNLKYAPVLSSFAGAIKEAFLAGKQFYSAVGLIQK